jgi:uncharacterized protein
MSERLALLDWRRRVAALYAEVRARHRAAPADAHAHWRALRDGLFRTHPCSPLPPTERSGFAGLPYYAYDPAFAFTARVDTRVTPERWDVPTSTGGTVAFERVGVVDLPVGRLDVLWLDDYAGGLFVPFRDATAGHGTYGGGRYLLDTAKDADLGSLDSGEVVLDFNFAYHPSCRHDPRWSCPLAPPGSRLDVAVEAGERA